MPVLNRTIDLLSLEQNAEDQELFVAVLEKLNNSPTAFFISKTQVHNIIITNKVTRKKQTYEIQLSHDLTRHRKPNSFLDTQTDKQKAAHPNFLRYDLETNEHIGEGGFANIAKLSKYFYLLDGSLKIKTKLHAEKNQIPSEDNTLEQIVREARLSRAALHLHAKPPILHPEGKRTTIVMRHFEGITLQQLLEDHEAYPITTEERYLLTINCLFALLEQIEIYGLIHGDIKPENIIVNPRTGKVTIIDFGLGDTVAKPENEEMRGTFDYMAPECLFGGASTTASDRFAMGMVLGNIWCDGVNFTEGAMPSYKKLVAETLERAENHSTLFTVPPIEDLSKTEKQFIRNGIRALTMRFADARYNPKDVIEHFITFYADRRFKTEKMKLEDGKLMKKAIDTAFHIRHNMQVLLLAKKNTDHEKLLALLESQLPPADFALNEFHKILGSQALQACFDKESVLRKVRDEHELTGNHLMQLNEMITRMHNEIECLQHFNHLVDVSEHIIDINILASEIADVRKKLEDAYNFDRRCELNAKYQDKIDKLNERITQLFTQVSPTVEFFNTNRDIIRSLQQPARSGEPREQLIFAIKQESLRYMQKNLNKTCIIKKQRAASTARLHDIKTIVSILDDGMNFDTELLISKINQHLTNMSHGIIGSELRDNIRNVIQQHENLSTTRRLSMS